MKRFSSEFEAWLKYADDDLAAAEHLFSVELYNLVCFHCHQAAEKTLKAFLISHGINPPRTHKLVTLLYMCTPKKPELEDLENDVIALDMYYIPTRYPNAPISILPDGLPNKKDAQNALAIAKNIRGRV